MIRAARKSALAARGALGPVEEMPFGEIAGVDPCNARHVEPLAQDIAQLAEDIADYGLLYPLIVRGEPGGWRVVAGGCRWRAMRTIYKPRQPVLVRVLEGDDEAAAAWSLRENIDRGALHPVDEADGVARMAERASVAEIARTLKRGARWVEQQIKLSGLPAVARAAWLSGRIGLPEARALTVGDEAAIVALFANPQAAAILSEPRLIANALRPKGVSSRTPAARYVGLEAYAAAGGRSVRFLFPDESGDEEQLLDPDLLRRLERQKLAAEADRICEAEGWGTVLFEPGDVGKCVKPDFTDDEIDELDKLAELLKAGEITAVDAETRDADIQRRAALRAVAERDRARYGVYVGLDMDGRLDVTRGVIVGAQSHSQFGVAPPTPAAGADAERAEVDEEAAAQRPRPPLPAPIPRPRAAPAAEPVLHAGARRLAAMAATKAIAGAVAGATLKPALSLAVAALASNRGEPVSLTFGAGPGGRAGELARQLSRLSFAQALKVCDDASLEALSAAFCEIVARAIDLRGADDADARALCAFTAGWDFDFAERLAQAFPYAGFFAEAGRPSALAAIRECGGAAAESERAWMLDVQLAEEAALLARAKSWLPEFLRGKKP